MNKEKAYKLEAQEFYFGPYDEFSSKQDGKVCYGSKEEFKNQIQSLVAQRRFSSVVKTAHHSYTFVPAKCKDKQEEYMPVRVYLSKEDCKGEYNNSGFFDDLIVTSKAINKSHNINRLALATGATALIVAGTMAFVSLVGYALEKEGEYQQAIMAPYIERQKEIEREKDFQQWLLEEQSRRKEEEKEMFGINQDNQENQKSK